MDAIIPETSQVEPQRFKAELYARSDGIAAKIAFRDAVVAHRHVGVDKHLKHRVFTSDEMRAAMMAAGLTGVATSPVDPN